MLRQDDRLSALAQGLIIGPALWGLVANFVLRAVPGNAGVLVVWVGTVGVGVLLAWREPSALRVSLRSVARFSVLVLAIFWVALASRQLLGNPDPIHLALAASIQAGTWPPELPWNPGQPLPYHYGVNLLIGLLAPPFGPDLPFTTELLGAYAWTSFALVAATSVIGRGGWISTFTLMPLLLTAGAWGLVIFPEVPDVLRVLLPTGLPSAGLRTALTDTYFPTAALPWAPEFKAAPPNIWRPGFVLAYGLAFTTFERITAAPGTSWPARLGLASLIGFMGLVDEAVALVVLGLWIALETVRLFQARPARAAIPRLALPSAAGPALAMLLLAVGGGVITGLFTGLAGGGLSLGWNPDPNSRGLIGSFELLPGGIGLLGIGPAIAAGASVILARRDFLTLTLAAASGAFLLASLILQYEFAEHDVVRLDGHARNFALLALLIALSMRLPAFRAPWRTITAVLLAALVVWPTACGPARNLSLAMSQGVHFSNAKPTDNQFDEAFWWMGRDAPEAFTSEAVTTWIRDHTAADARILSPYPHATTAHTGRPNASGFAEFVHLFPVTGPAYHDATTYLEPAALRRLGVAYLHAPDTWVVGLSDQVARRLANPDFFELLVRGETDALYRVQTAFLRLDSSPAAGSFEALRQAVPALTTVYLTRDTDPLAAIRVAAALPQAQVLGTVSTASLHPLTRIQTEPSGDQMPEIVIAATHLPPGTIPSGDAVPVWRTDHIAVYDLGGSVVPLMPPPAPPRQSVKLSHSSLRGDRIDFAVTFTNPTSERWISQDWVVLDADASLWEVLQSLEAGRGTPWFGGQIDPRPGLTTFNYQFRATTGELFVRNADGTLLRVPSSGHDLSSGVWTLTMRLRDSHRKAHLFPLIRYEILADGGVRYEADGVVLNATQTS